MELIELVDMCTGNPGCEKCTAHKECKKFQRVLKDIELPYELRRLVEAFPKEKKND